MFIFICIYIYIYILSFVLNIFLSLYTILQFILSYYSRTVKILIIASYYKSFCFMTENQCLEHFSVREQADKFCLHLNRKLTGKDILIK